MPEKSPFFCIATKAFRTHDISLALSALQHYRLPCGADA
jgi:hypothetical protein